MPEVFQNTVTEMKVVFVLFAFLTACECQSNTSLPSVTPTTMEPGSNASTASMMTTSPATSIPMSLTSTPSFSPTQTVSVTASNTSISMDSTSMMMNSTSAMTSSPSMMPGNSSTITSPSSSRAPSPPSPSSSPTPTTEPQSSHKGATIAAAILVPLAVILVLVGVAGVVYYFYRKHHTGEYSPMENVDGSYGGTS